MQRGKLDAYIIYFKMLANMAGYNPNNHLCLKYFTDGLLAELYKDVLRLDHPRNYTEWKEAALSCNGEWEHCKNRKVQHCTLGKSQSTMYNPFSMVPTWPQHSHHDPDTMDTTAD